MKNKIIMLMLFVVMLLISGCDNEVSFTDISIDTSKVKMTFIVGEEFNSEGLIVTAKYSNNSEEKVTEFLVDSAEYQKDIIGTYKIKVTYTKNEITKEKTYEVDVVKDPNSIVLTNLTLDTSKVKTDYVIGEELTLDGIIVTAHYSNDTSKEITEYEVNKSGFNKDKVGVYRILVSITEDNIIKTAIYSVNVKTILSTVNYLIGIDVMPRNVEFLLGSEFNTNSLVVMAIYQDGSKVDVTDKVTIDSSQYNKDIVGVYEIIIDYDETYGSGASEVNIAWDSFYFARVVNKLSEGE